MDKRLENIATEKKKKSFPIMRDYRIILLSFLAIIFLVSFKNQTEDENEKWTSLFNRKDLSDWHIKIKGHPLDKNYKNTFRVVDGVMQVNYDEYNGVFNASYGHIFYKNEFSNYKFRLQYRFTGEQIADGAGWARRNSGVMIHCQAPETMELNQNFPVSIKVQLLGGLSNGEVRSTGNLCTPGTHVVMDDKLVIEHCIDSSSKTYNGDQWVNLEILVRNDSVISHKINGETVITYYKPQIGGSVENVDDAVWKPKEGNALKKGYISLQSESHPVEFRNIEILELKN